MLYVIATPIGNLSEMSGRALEVLKSVYLIAAEDTRHSKILLDHFGIKTKMVVYQKFNEKASAQGLIELLKSGKDIALISDAGMPLISDPGEVLIGECIRNGIEITVVSGPSACINALVLSGLKSDEFVFLGFLPDKQALREKRIRPYIMVPASLIFYSTAHSITKDLDFLFRIFGPRKVAIARELTKKFEEVTRGVLGEHLKAKEKGEIVIVLEGYSRDTSTLNIKKLIDEYLSMGLSKMEAIKQAAKDKGVSKSEAYRIHEEA